MLILVLKEDKHVLCQCFMNNVMKGIQTVTIPSLFSASLLYPSPSVFHNLCHYYSLSIGKMKGTSVLLATLVNDWLEDREEIFPFSKIIADGLGHMPTKNPKVFLATSQRENVVQDPVHYEARSCMFPL